MQSPLQSLIFYNSIQQEKHLALFKAWISIRTEFTKVEVECVFINVESDKVLVAVVSDASGGDWGFSDSSCYSDRYKIMVRKDNRLLI